MTAEARAWLTDPIILRVAVIAISVVLAACNPGGSGGY
jgi:hypothetical protein